MSNRSSDSQHETIYLSTAEAAERMRVSKLRVRRMCNRVELEGAFQERDNSPWQIPAEAVEDWIARHGAAKAKTSMEVEVSSPVSAPRQPPDQHTRLQRLRDHPVTVVLSVLVVVVTILAALISAGADIGGARQQLQEWRLVRAFPSATVDEVLIVIATFDYAQGIADTHAHNEIRRAIQSARDELGLSHLRVEIEPTRLTADDRAGAEALGRRYNASIVVWGSDTGVRVTVNFLNLKQPDFYAAEVKIDETERTQLANPSDYAIFITGDLPGQLTFLSLFAIGQSHYIKGAYTDSIRVIERAVDSLVPGMEPPEGLAEAYFDLGWLYQGPMDDNEQAIAQYDQAIALNPNYAPTYNNRGIARANQGDLNGAIADFDQAIALNPDYARAYNNRGLVRAEQGDPEDAIANYDQAITLNPEYVSAYNNRGTARADQGDLDGAIADFDQAIALNPNYAPTYNNRGTARADQGNLDGAIADFDRAITLNPDYAEAYTNRGFARAKQGDLEGAIADHDQAIALKPDLAGAYTNRGLARYDQGDLDGAIADFDQAIALKPDLAEAYNGRGLARHDQDDLDGAIADFDQAIALKPDLAEAYINRGIARAIQGDLEGAIADFDQVIALKPDSAIAYWNRGAAHRRHGNTESALADFRRYLGLRPGDEYRKVVEEWIAELEAQVSDQ